LEQFSHRYNTERSGNSQPLKVSFTRRLQNTVLVKTQTNGKHSTQEHDTIVSAISCSLENICSMGLGNPPVNRRISSLNCERTNLYYLIGNNLKVVQMTQSVQNRQTVLSPTPI